MFLWAPENNGLAAGTPELLETEQCKLKRFFWFI
jgi:hypothetical protein